MKGGNNKMELEQFIETLSEDEKQRHKELIEECRLRSVKARNCVSKYYEIIERHTNKAPQPTFS